MPLPPSAPERPSATDGASLRPKRRWPSSANRLECALRGAHSPMRKGELTAWVIDDNEQTRVLVGALLRSMAFGHLRSAPQTSFFARCRPRPNPPLLLT